MSRSAACLVLAVAAALAQGCSSACIDVQVILCQCRFQTQDEQNSCKTSAQSQESLDPPADDELVSCETIATACQAQVDNYGCDSLQSPAGRKACGLAAQ